MQMPKLQQPNYLPFKYWLKSGFRMIWSIFHYINKFPALSWNGACRQLVKHMESIFMTPLSREIVEKKSWAGFGWFWLQQVVPIYKLKRLHPPFTFNYFPWVCINGADLATRVLGEAGGGSHGRYNLTIQTMIEFRSKMIQFNFRFKRKLSKIIQFNFQFKRKLSGFNSKKIFN